MPMPGSASQPSTDLVVTEFATVSLIDPLSLERIRDPVRGLECDHAGAFDRTAYVEYYTKQERRSFVQRKALWRCPICSRFCRPNQLAEHSELAKVLRSPELDEEATWAYLMPGGKFQSGPPAQHHKRGAETQEFLHKQGISHSSSSSSSRGSRDAPSQRGDDLPIPAAKRSCTASSTSMQNHADTQKSSSSLTMRVATEIQDEAKALGVGCPVEEDAPIKPSREALVWALTRSRSSKQGSALETAKKSHLVDKVEEMESPSKKRQRTSTTVTGSAKVSVSTSQAQTEKPATASTNMVTPTRGRGTGRGRGRGATRTSTGAGRSLPAMFQSAATQSKRENTSSMQQLVAMGFSVTESSEAMKEAKGDLAAAVGILCERTIL